MTESETRILIDEQLRKFAWEADTNNLRYSKGTRPIKGHNLAIAEWKTDSEVGDGGFVDYALFIGIKLVGLIEAKASYKNISSVLGKNFKCRLFLQRTVEDTWRNLKLCPAFGFKIYESLITRQRYIGAT